MDNRSHQETDWDLELLGPELEELQALDFDLELTGFDQHEIDDFLADPGLDDRANAAPPVPDNPTTKLGDLWLCGKHRILCGDATAAGEVEVVIIAKLDRLTRSAKDLCKLLERFTRRGVALISVAESLDTGSAAGRLVLNIMTAVS